MASVEGAAVGKEGEVVEVPGSQDIQPATQAEVDAGIARASKGGGVPTTSLRGHLPFEFIGKFREGGIADVLVPGATMEHRTQTVSAQIVAQAALTILLETSGLQGTHKLWLSIERAAAADLISQHDVFLLKGLNKEANASKHDPIPHLHSASSSGSATKKPRSS